MVMVRCSIASPPGLFCTGTERFIPLFPIRTILWDGDQIAPGDVGPLVAQKLGDTEAGTERTRAAVDQLLVGPGGVTVAQAMVGYGAGGTFILNFGPHLIDVLLEPGNGDVGGHAVRDKQLVAPGCDSQQLFHPNGNAFVDGYSSDLAALAFDGDGIFPEGLFRFGCINAEALVDAQSGVPGQAGDGGKVLVIVCQTGRQKTMKLLDAPGTVHPTEAAALQLHRQFVVGGQAVFCPLHLVVKETNARQVGLDGRGGLAPILHIEHISGQVFAVDVGQLL